MKKRLIGILILFMLVGCGEKKQMEVQESPYTPCFEETVVEANTAEKNKLKACFGTVKDISDSSITIEGVDKKIYTGDKLLVVNRISRKI